MELNIKREHRLIRRMSKFILVEEKNFEKAQDVYTYYNQAMQYRAQIASAITKGDAELENLHKQLRSMDDELKRIGLHIPEVREVARQEYDRKKNKRREDVEKGVVRDKLFKPGEKPSEGKEEETKPEEDIKDGIKE